jgi:hypothetical protein
MNPCGIHEKNKKKPEKAHTFVWEPLKGFNLEPRFLTWTLVIKKQGEPNRLISSYVCGRYNLWFRTTDGIGRPTEIFFAENHFFMDEKS